MKQDNGSAVVIVLLFLGIVSVVGAGLMLQSSVDRQFTSAVKSIGSLRDVASTAAAISYRKLRDVFSLPSDISSTDPVVYTQLPDDSDHDGWVEGNLNGSKFFYRLIFMGRGSSTGATTAGDELGFGGGGSYGAGQRIEILWNAEGRGRNRGSGDSEARVQIAVKKAHSGN